MSHSSQPHSSHASAAQESSHGRPRWRFYLTSAEAWDGMHAACERATASIDIEQFIFHDDAVGQRFIELLTRKAAQGVRVRLLCDTVGSYFFYLSYLPDRLRAAGIEVRFFNEIKPSGLLRFKKWFSRDHRKVLVIDRDAAFVGGVGINERFKDWRDTLVEFLGGSVVQELQAAFDHMWWIAGRDRFIRFKDPRQTDDGFTVYGNAPHFRQRFINRTALDVIRSAKHSVYITTPYFVPDAHFFRVLRLAARRGVDVRVLLPYASDHPYVDFASHFYFAQLFKVGARVFEYQGAGGGGQMIHAKTMVVDDAWASVGSANIDNLSSFFNYEIMVASHDRKFAEEVKKQFAHDISHADEILPARWGRRSFFQKGFELLCIPFASFF